MNDNDVLLKIKISKKQLKQETLNNKSSEFNPDIMKDFVLSIEEEKRLMNFVKSCSPNFQK